MAIFNSKYVLNINQFFKEEIETEESVSREKKDEEQETHKNDEKEK